MADSNTTAHRAMTSPKQRLVKYDIEKLTVGPLLGSGGFASVYGVWETDSVDNKKAIEFDLKNKREEVGEADHTHGSDAVVSLDSSSVSSSSSTADAVGVRQHTHGSEHLGASHTKYAIKILHSKSIDDPAKFRISTSDFENEVRVLSALPRHENIIDVHGVSHDFWASPKTAFIVMERLVEPLDRAIRRWRHEASGGLKWVTKKHLCIVAQAERIERVAIDLASAMTFLREQLVLFRDLKPANIGCGQDGKIKLFDFGLARKLKNDRTRVIGRNGTLRYMSPECALNEMYGFPSDVYSFGQVLWELLMLEKPYRKIKDKFELNLLVINKEKHPAVNKIASPPMKRLLERCWSPDPERRPPFSYILSELKKEVAVRLPHHQ